ncbi:UNVERIFIED_CONTAM: hypothetical protein Slati_3735400 [Sesamum latifolium]|uniref:Uncharacterized protein n=1 Tax=Sesamum latifolium TaxID=2727402 RepID=A0AAW2U496_9LAMI
MATHSVVGPDGFNAVFYQRCWDIIKHDVLDAVQDFLQGTPPPVSFTATSIALIPKKLYYIVLVFHHTWLCLSETMSGIADSTRRLHWSSWNRLCYPEEEGGLGVRSLSDTVAAFSQKLWWRFRTSSSLWASFLKKRYCKRSCPVSTKIYSSGTSQWRRMRHAEKQTEKLIFWSLEKGEVCFWHDNWLGDSPLADLVQLSFTSHEKVNHYWKESAWDITKLQYVLSHDIIANIIMVPFDEDVEDKPWWKESSNGAFSLKCAWNALRVVVGCNVLHL